MVAMMSEHTCWWCGQPAVEQKVIVPEDRNRRTGELRKAAVSHWVCRRHARMVDREVRMRDVEHRIVLAERRLARNDTPIASGATLKRARAAKVELERYRDELAELRAERDG